MNLEKYERNQVVFAVSLLKQKRPQDFRFMFSLQRRSKPGGKMLKDTFRSVTLTPVEYAFLVHFISFGRKGESYQIRRQRPNRNPRLNAISVIQACIQENGDIKITLGVFMVRAKSVSEELSFTMTHNEADELYCVVDSHLELYYQLLAEARAVVENRTECSDEKRPRQGLFVFQNPIADRHTSEIDTEDLIRITAFN